MSYSLNSLKGVRKGIILGSNIEVIKGDTRSLDYSSYGVCQTDPFVSPLLNQETPVPRPECVWAA